MKFLLTKISLSRFLCFTWTVFQSLTTWTTSDRQLYRVTSTLGHHVGRQATLQIPQKSDQTTGMARCHERMPERCNSCPEIPLSDLLLPKSQTSSLRSLQIIHQTYICISTGSKMKVYFYAKSSSSFYCVVIQ